jgi:hypothetical protein
MPLAEEEVVSQASTKDTKGVFESVKEEEELQLIEGEPSINEEEEDDEEDSEEEEDENDM